VTASRQSRERRRLVRRPRRAREAAGRDASIGVRGDRQSARSSHAKGAARWARWSGSKRKRAVFLRAIANWGCAAAPARSQMCETERPDLGGDGVPGASWPPPRVRIPWHCPETASRPQHLRRLGGFRGRGPPSAKSAPRRPRRASGRRGPPPRRSPPRGDHLFLRLAYMSIPPLTLRVWPVM
jgi:hypothetical protein